MSGQGVSRPAARAGQFYPGDARGVHESVERFLASGRSASWSAGFDAPRALMLPHAGWMFCGETIGTVLSAAAPPPSGRVVVIGPKHTPFGPAMSVASHERWIWPGGEVEIDADARDRLLEWTPELTAETEAHRMEHGVEVLAPFLDRWARTGRQHGDRSDETARLRLLPIALGAVDFETTTRLAEALRRLIDQTGALPIISSDMNHFAPEQENRRRDGLALEAMADGDARKLVETCREHEVSMCGVLPAATVMQALAPTTPGRGDARCQSEPRESDGAEIRYELLDYRTSAQVTRDRSSVVGYAGVVAA